MFQWISVSFQPSNVHRRTLVSQVLFDLSLMQLKCFVGEKLYPIAKWHDLSSIKLKWTKCRADAVAGRGFLWPLQAAELLNNSSSVEDWCGSSVVHLLCEWAEDVYIWPVSVHRHPCTQIHIRMIGLRNKCFYKKSMTHHAVNWYDSVCLQILILLLLFFLTFNFWFKTSKLG